MRAALVLLILSASLLVTAAAATAEEQVQLEITFAAPPHAEGSVHAALFSDEESFKSWQDPVRNIVLPLGDEALSWTPEPLPPGTYALLAFPDTNGDGVLTVDERRRPLEPFTASGRMGRGGPRFKRAAIELAAGEHRLEIDEWRYRARAKSER